MSGEAVSHSIGKHYRKLKIDRPKERRNMIAILITLLIAAVIIYVVYLIIGMITLPAPIKNIVYIIVGLIILLWLLQYFNIYHIG